MKIYVKKDEFNRSFDLSIQKIIDEFHSMDDPTERKNYIQLKLNEWTVVDGAEFCIDRCSKMKRHLLRRMYIGFILLGLLRLAETEQLYDDM